MVLKTIFLHRILNIIVVLQDGHNIHTYSHHNNKSEQYLENVYRTNHIDNLYNVLIENIFSELYNAFLKLYF